MKQAVTYDNPEESAAVDSVYMLPFTDEVSLSGDRTHKVRKLLGAAAVAVGIGAVGGSLGLIAAMHTDAHTEIGGTAATIRMTGSENNELNVNNGLATFKKASGLTIAGQPASVRLGLQVDTNKLFVNGETDPKLLPAYLSLFSDTDQIKDDLEWAVIKHGLIGTAWGVGLAEAAFAFGSYYKKKYPNPEGSKFLKRVAFATIASSVLATVPAASAQTHETRQLQFDPRLTGTPLADVEIGGTIKPGIRLLEKYFETYVTDTNKYYDDLQKRLAEYLAANPLAIPGGDDIVNFGYVADRHCNIGMDRVTVGLMNAYGIKLLVSGGDDAFSGSFPFESACTSNLAERSKKSKISVVVAPGNHDSTMITGFEKEQGIDVLEGNLLNTKGLAFVGSPDPRASRYGEGITIHGHAVTDAEQVAATTVQGKKLGELACKANKTVIVVAHDPNAGKVALETGCGNAVLALNGHTHMQSGPTSMLLSNGTTGHQYTSGTSGGAPNEQSHGGSILDHVTVGPLNHPAKVNILSYDKSTDILVGVTVFTFNPDKTISSETLPLAGPQPADTRLHTKGYKLPNSTNVFNFSASAK